MVAFTCNGQRVELEPRDDESLLETLRNHVGLRSLKDGCRPQGQCGACLAIVDGHPRVTCTLPTAMVDGQEVVTLEGLTGDERRALAQAFTAAAAGQCGFCVPGIALHTHALLQKHPQPSDTEVERALDVHLCRCGGYARIAQAVRALARHGAGEALAEPLREGGVGSSLARLDAEAAVLGTRPFVGDLVRPGMLHGAVLLSPHARARVLRIDTAPALAMEGVVAVATARDLPGERFQGLLLRDWPVFVAEGEEVRCVGDVLAAVAAVDEATARRAADAIVVDLEPLAPVVDTTSALAEGAQAINPRQPSERPNLLSRTVLRRGDVDAALAASAHVVRERYETQRIEHLFLETECALAEPAPGGGLSVHTQGQGIFDDRAQIASALGLSEEQVRVELVPPGGAFGGKEDLSIQVHAALLAKLTGRPVRLALDREQSIRMHPKRHPFEMHYELGCDADGKLTALRARLVGDSGAYASVGAKVLERAAGHASGAYAVPAVDVEALAVTTNNPPAGAMRGFGVPQVSFAMESCLDMLAAKLGLDRFEIRRRNVLRVGDRTTTGQRLVASVGLEETLLAVKPAYDEAVAQGLAVGLACGIKNSGIGNGVEEWGRARLEIERGRVVVYNGYTEMGQGLSTVLVQIASEASGLSATLFDVRTDTRYQLACGQTTGSRATLLGGHAVLTAARKLGAELSAGASLEALEGRVYAADEAIRDTTAPEADVPEPKTHTAYGFATQLCVLDAEGRVSRFVAAHDVGRVINPALCAGQIEGSIVMGLGYALTEELECEQGMPKTLWLRDLGALRARDTPEVEVIFVEAPQPEGPYGAKGVGEIGLVPTAAAVANALAAFDGVRRTRLPMRDSPAAKAMSVAHAHAHARPAPQAHVYKRAGS